MAHLETLRKGAASPLSVSQGTLGQISLNITCQNVRQSELCTTWAHVGWSSVGDKKKFKKKTSNYFNKNLLFLNPCNCVYTCFAFFFLILESTGEESHEMFSFLCD